MESLAAQRFRFVDVLKRPVEGGEGLENDKDSSGLFLSPPGRGRRGNDRREVMRVNENIRPSKRLWDKWLKYGKRTRKKKTIPS